MKSHGPRSYIRALVLLTVLLLAMKSAIAGPLTIADYDSYYALSVRMRPIGDDFAAFMTHPPMPGGASPAGIEAARTQNCIIELAGNYDTNSAKLNTVGLLIGLAARMVDGSDELLVISLLRNEALTFLKSLKFYRQMLSSTTRKCYQDGATVAKSQELSRLYDDADTFVQSIVKKIGAEAK
jgi:hypothetical protein